MNRHIIFYIIAILFVLTQTIPPVNIIMPFNPSVEFAVFDVITLLLFSNLLLKKSVIAMFLYGLIMFLYYLAGNAFFDTIATVIVPFLVMLSGLLLIEYTLAYDNKNYVFTRIIIMVVIFSNIIMTIISIPQVFLIPNIIRPSSQDLIYGEEEYYWIIKYATCHGLTFFFAPLMFLCRKTYHNNKWLCLFWFLVSALLLYIVFLSNATTPLLISIVMIVFGLVFKGEKITNKTVWAIILVGIVFLFVSQPKVTVPIINTAQQLMNPASRNYTKMDEIRDAVIYGDSDGDLGARQDLYATSTDLFIESPLTGTYSPERISHHSWIIDRLACFGIILFIPIFLIFYFHIKSTYKRFTHTKLIYSISFLGFIIMLILKNEFGAGTWLYGFAFLPVLCRYIDYVIDNKLIIKK